MNLWGSRMGKNLDQEVAEFSTSINEDQQFYWFDILGSLAHCKMLQKIEILNQTEAQQIQRGLVQILQNMEKNQIDLSIYEDIHSAVEMNLKQIIGEPAEKLHTARSRNDQIVLDERLFLREKIIYLIQGINEFQKGLLTLAQNYPSLVMPGYTHLQPAQPVLFAHHLLAYFFMLQRDAERLKDALTRLNQLPLGAGALAGSSIPIDRKFVAELLAFPLVQINSMDVVADRDYILEILNALSIAFLHLSRFGEEIVLWSSPGFQFIIIDDAFTTGSSIMPQKKNPDIAELIRGKAGEIIASWVSLAVALKGIPLTYNRDLQQDKPPLLRAIRECEKTFHIAARLINNIQPNQGKMEAALKDGFLTATDLCEYLVGKGIPFRKAHEIVGSIVRELASQEKSFHDLNYEELKRYIDCIDREVMIVLEEKQSITRKRSEGSTSPQEVEKQIVIAQKLLDQWMVNNTRLVKEWQSKYELLLNVE
ncbi:MAG: argininosuccinate lyase [Candidatus Atribacteria bacterium]|nr:argininosuccinate lyase [Candidatus Atribacteria bacterium]